MRSLNLLATEEGETLASESKKTSKDAVDEQRRREGAAEVFLPRGAFLAGAARKSSKIIYVALNRVNYFTFSDGSLW